MIKKYVFLTFIFSLISCAKPAFCLLEEVDFSGLTMAHHFKQRITDDTIAKAVKGHSLTVSWLCDELDDDQYKDVVSLNLSENFISDEGAENFGKFLANGYLPALKELDLSYNRITEEGIRHFSSLLSRKKFEYLVIYGNSGASSKEGIIHLLSRLSPADPDTLNAYLSKIIFVPEGWIERTTARGYLSPPLAESHKTYFHRKMASFLSNTSEDSE